MVSNKKRQKRIRESVEELTQQIYTKNESESVTLKVDADLFHIDRVGSKAARKRLNKAAEINISGKGNPVEGKRLLSKVLKKINTKRANSVAVDGSTAYDLWNEEADAKKSPNRPSHKSAIRIAAPGQSYNPSLESHQVGSPVKY